MFNLADHNIVWWKVAMPDRNEDGDLVTVPVRLQFRIFTRAELRDMKIKAMRGGMSDISGALNDLTKAEDPAAAKSAVDSVESAIDKLLETSSEIDRDVRERLVGWREEDVSVPFDEEWRDKLLGDEVRFEAVRKGLFEASRGAPAKN